MIRDAVEALSESSAGKPRVRLVRAGINSIPVGYYTFKTGLFKPFEGRGVDVDDIPSSISKRQQRSYVADLFDVRESVLQFGTNESYSSGYWFYSFTEYLDPITLEEDDLFEAADTLFLSDSGGLEGYGKETRLVWQVC